MSQLYTNQSSKQTDNINIIFTGWQCFHLGACPSQSVR